VNKKRNKGNFFEQAINKFLRKEKLKVYALNKLPKYTDSGRKVYWKICIVTPIDGYDNQTGKPKVTGMSFLVGYNRWRDSEDTFNECKIGTYTMRGRTDYHSSFTGRDGEWDISYFFSKSSYKIKDL